MLRAGIPAWHLPEDVLEAELAKLLDLGGIEIRCGVPSAPPASPPWTSWPAGTMRCSWPSARTSAAA